MAKAPNHVDVEVGLRMRARRKQLGLSQGKLGDKLGITFQQVQKYEKGTNRVGASRLQAVASALNVSVSYFFDEAREGHSSLPKSPTSLLIVPGATDLLTAYGGISNPRLRKVVFDLARNLASSTATGAAADANKARSLSEVG